MSTYSHRDHRGFRAAYRLLGVVTAATLGLVGVSYVAPAPLLGVGALVGLAVLGAGALWTSSSVAESYADDLRRAHPEATGPASLRVEVESRVALDRPVFVGGRPSPNGRRPRRGLSTEPGAALPVGERA